MAHAEFSCDTACIGFRCYEWTFNTCNRKSLYVAEILRPKMTIIAVGERPGMSSFDSMGLYFTYAPRFGMQDGERNCISNIRVPGGLDYVKAASQAVFLIEECCRQKLSGVTVKLSTEQEELPLLK